MAYGLLRPDELVAAPLDSGAVAANDAANYVFAQRVRRCLVTAIFATVTDVFYRVNSSPTAGSNEASATVFDGVLKTGETQEISLEADRSILSVSIFVPATATSITLRVVGLLGG